MAASNIKRAAHTGRKKAEIRKLVDDEFPKREEMTTFVQTIPLVITWELSPSHWEPPSQKSLTNKRSFICILSNIVPANSPGAMIRDQK
jgi:hypothetical protein